MTPLLGLAAVLAFVLVLPAVVGLFDIARSGSVREWWLS